MLKPDLIVFDFDGVVADSEVGANQVLAEALTALGRPTTLEDCLTRYMGRRWADCAALIEADLGARLPEGFVDICREGIAAHHAAALHAVPGVAVFLDGLGDTPRCVASSSSLEWLASCLARLGFAHHFGSHVFSASQVEHGKPAPDLFLLAARTMGVAPQRCLVIEDSAPGVQAGRAAGMTVVGLCAGGHVRDGHAERLRAAGAHHVVASYTELSALMERIRAMPETNALMRQIYEGFNRRDIPAVLSHLAEDVEWANGMDGGHVLGREAVRDYWTRQWASIRPQVEALQIIERGDGVTAVEVRQVVHDLGGRLLLDETVRHVFRITGGLITRFDIENAGGLSKIAHG